MRRHTAHDTARVFLFAGALAIAAGTYALATESNPTAMRCEPHEQLAADLGTRFGERRVWRGWFADGNPIELYLSVTGSWSVLIKHRSGKFCLAAHGTSWRTWPLPVKGRRT